MPSESEWDDAMENIHNECHTLYDNECHTLCDFLSDLEYQWKCFSQSRESAITERTR